MTDLTKSLAFVFLWGFTITLGYAQESAVEDTVTGEESELTANNPGLNDLDQATELRLTADSMADLERIARLCESAMKAGLDEQNSQYAVELMTAALYEHAARLSQPLLSRQSQQRQRQALRALALKDLERLLEVDDTLAAAYILLAQLRAMSNKERESAQVAADRAIELLTDGDDKEQLSQVFAVKSHLTDDSDQQLEWLNKAVEMNAANLEAIRSRGLVFLRQNKHDKAIADFQLVLEKDPEELTALHGIGEAFAGSGNFGDAIDHVSRAIETSPNSFTSYLLRAKIYVQAAKIVEAMADLDKSISIYPKNIPGLMARAQLRLQQNEFDRALADVNRVLELSPQMPQAILFRSLIFEASERLHDAIKDIDQLMRQNPGNVELQLQLARLYGMDQRTSKSIALYEEVLRKEPSNAHALRGRADSLLNTGQQAAAIEAYKSALEHMPDDSGILNNLAWVLATSPDDTLRNADRSLELATKACEVTEYKAAHIVSTLAAAYAEQGDFDNAIKYSSQAIELGEDEAMKTQLQKELESYQANQPWRELQEIEEKPEPESPNESDLLLESN